ncbi:MAG: trypsin-like peptidase domain-containing protein [Firmicutes bacterium]|nr:trypsin-like peptidase domain-containing protein [Bacillota bacterium]
MRFPRLQGARLPWAAAVIAAAALLIVYAGLPEARPTAAQGQQAPLPLAENGPYSIADVVDAVGPAVVFIEVEYQQTRTGPQGMPFPGFPFPSEWFWPYPQPSPRGGSGSGFIIDEKGLVLTNQHLFSQPNMISSITVTLPEGHETYEARLVGYDYELDLAILEIQGEGPFPTVPLGDSDTTRVGEWLIAIGNPYQLEHTVTVGVLSAKGREIAVRDDSSNTPRVYRNLMQTDAAINPGNSGGPLINLKGEAIGINTAVSTQGQGIGFAIPINAAKEVLDDLINRGMVVRPFIGIRYSSLDEATARQLRLSVDQGIIIWEVIPDTAAERAGLRVYDVITEVNRQPVTGTEDFLAAIEGIEVGDVLLFTVIRDGREVAVRVEVGQRPANMNL